MFLSISRHLSTASRLTNMARKLVLVTGGNNGIGFETCAQLAEQPGNHVLMASRSLEKGKEAIEKVQQRAPKASIELVQLDITSDESIAAAVRQVTEKHGRLDTLINNAGICPMDTSRETFREAFEVNVTSPSMTTHAFAPLLRKADSPRVIYVGSRLGSITQRSSPHNKTRGGDYRVYSASKAALSLVAMCDAREYQSDGFKVFAYCPGFVVTDLANMREAKVKMGTVPGPEKSARGLVLVHEGKQDDKAEKFLSSDSVVDGMPELAW